MPYVVKQRIKNCYGVVVPSSNRVFSSKCQTKKMARKQRLAVILSESRKTGKPVNTFFA